MNKILTLFLFSIQIIQSSAEKSVHLAVWSQFSAVPGKLDTFLAEVPASDIGKGGLVVASAREAWQ